MLKYSTFYFFISNNVRIAQKIALNLFRINTINLIVLNR